MIDPKEHLLAALDAYVAATGVADKTISYRVFNDSKKIGALRAGASITSGRLVEALQWLSDHWPDGITWPADVPRPERAAA
jgi:hypothetical protein